MSEAVQDPVVDPSAAPAADAPPVGYLDDWTVRAGEQLALHVSCAAATFEARLVRPSYEPAQGVRPDLVEHPIPSDLDGRRFPGGVQAIEPGSWLEAEHALTFDEAVGVDLWFLPTYRDGVAALASLTDELDERPGYVLSLDGRGRPTLQVGSGDEASILHLDVETTLDRWYRVAFDHDRRSGRLQLSLWGPSQPGQPGSEPPLGRVVVERDCGPGPVAYRVRLGVHVAGGRRTNHFDGKLDSPTLHDQVRDHDVEWADPVGPRPALARWDLSQHLDRDLVVDVSGHGNDARVRNRPMRAVTGRTWDGSVQHPDEDATQYRAVKFHRDDLDDVGWEVSARFRLPSDLPSGAYAVRLQAGGSSTHVPFFVVPATPPPRRSKPLAIVVPTFTYLAYANEHIFEREAVHDWIAQVHSIGQVVYPVDPHEAYVLEHHLNSCYDLHPDGSGVTISTRRRPIVNVRPEAEMRHLADGKGSPHGYGSDLFLLGWLDHDGVEYDVLTDEAVHHGGDELLAGYRAIVLASHPEYVTEAFIDACEEYVDQGGRLLYLGGNGLYWVITLDPYTGDAIELRRWAGTQGWAAAAGERHHAMTGEAGGTWRGRGRAPQRLLGVGFCAQGFDRNTSYRREPDGQDPVVGWVLEGVDGEVIGDEPNLVNVCGAAGFEVDKADPDLGTPEGTRVIASARNFSTAYSACDEDKRAAGLDPMDPGDGLEIRADMTLWTNRRGGAVFSVGSIAWCGSLWSEGDAARITRNVLDRFCASDVVDVLEEEP